MRFLITFGMTKNATKINHNNCHSEQSEESHNANPQYNLNAIPHYIRNDKIQHKVCLSERSEETHNHK